MGAPQRPSQRAHSPAACAVNRWDAAMRRREGCEPARRISAFARMLVGIVSIRAITDRVAAWLVAQVEAEARSEATDLSRSLAAHMDGVRGR